MDSAGGLLAPVSQGLATLAGAVEATPLPALVNQGFAYPLLNLLHLLGLLLLLGAIGLVDLRLVGFFPRLPREALVRALTPAGLAGLVLLAVTGPLLFAADARALAGNPALVAKLALILLALLNALLFRRLWRPGRPPSVPLRALAALSLILWLAVAALGRWIAYV